MGIGGQPADFAGVHTAVDADLGAIVAEEGSAAGVGGVNVKIGSIRVGWLIVEEKLRKQMRKVLVSRIAAVESRIRQGDGLLEEVFYEKAVGKATGAARQAVVAYHGLNNAAPAPDDVIVKKTVVEFTERTQNQIAAYQMAG